MIAPGVLCTSQPPLHLGCAHVTSSSPGSPDQGSKELVSLLHLILLLPMSPWQTWNPSSTKYTSGMEMIDPEAAAEESRWCTQDVYWSLHLCMKFGQCETEDGRQPSSWIPLYFLFGELHSESSTLGPSWKSFQRALRWSEVAWTHLCVWQQPVQQCIVALCFTLVFCSLSFTLCFLLRLAPSQIKRQHFNPCLKLCF